MTKSVRGAANIKKFNEKRTEITFSKVEKEIERCKKYKMKFVSLANLVEYIGSVTKVHRTTLTRNLQYKRLLAEFAGLQGRQAADISDEDAPPEVLRARILALKLEISNVNDKLRRLEAYIQQRGESSAPSVPAEQMLSAPSDNNSNYLAFVDTAMALTALLERLKETIVINFMSKTIEDLAARPSQRVVVGSERATTYLEWLQRQKHLLLGVVDGNR